MPKKYIVDLSETERQSLEKLTTTGKHAAYKINHARILLKADVNQADEGWSDEARASALDISISTIERVRRRFVEEGIEAANRRRMGSGRKQKRLDGEQEAHLVAISKRSASRHACSEPPKGQARWTLRLLADKMVELKHVESLCHETVRQTLKKTNFSLGDKNAG